MFGPLRGGAPLRASLCGETSLERTVTKASSRLLVGLGNPGPEYEGTRHNIGFEVLDLLALREGLIFQSAKQLEGFDGVARARCARIYDPDALLVKPMTFMNRSGEAAAPLAQWSGASPEDVLAVYDDLDLPLGALRLRSGGGAGGHNGVRSLIEQLGTDRFPRLRVGIGRPATDAVRHVLGEFSSDERPDVEISVAEAADAALEWLRTGDLEKVMTRFHSRWTQGDS